MISFIVIGKNEAKHLKECLDCIFKCIEINNINDAEVVFIDSNSNDNSIEIASSFQNIKIIKANTLINAAIARNIGANETTQQILFFIDGDICIKDDFITNVIDAQKNIKFDFVTGVVQDVVDDSNTTDYCIHPKYKVPKEPSIIYNARGVFLIKRNLWEKVNGLHSKYKFPPEDADLLYKLLKIDVYFYKLPQLIGKHYEKKIYSFSIIFNSLLAGKYLYRGVFYRNYVLSSKIFTIISKSNYLKFMLFIYLIIIASVTLSSFYILLLYFVPVLGKIFLEEKSINLLVLKKLIYHLCKDLSNVFSFLFFYPQKIKNISYEIVKYSKK